MSAASPQKSGPKGKKKAKPNPVLVQLKERLAQVELPKIDPAVALAAGMMVAITLGSSVLAVRFWLPSQRILVRDGDVDPRPTLKGPGIGSNPVTRFDPVSKYPSAGTAAFISPLASVIGNVTLQDRVFVAPNASVKGTGHGVYIGPGSSIMENAVVTSLPTGEGVLQFSDNQVDVDGQPYGVWIGRDVVIAPQAQVFGPAQVGDQTFIGMGALVYRAYVSQGAVVEPHAVVIGVKIRPNRYVLAGKVIRTQQEADALPLIPGDGYAFRQMANQLKLQNQETAKAYLHGAGGQVGPTPKPEVIQAPADDAN